MHRQLSLLTPSGHLTLGNLLGALRPMAATQHEDCFYGIADLHAMTTPHDPARLRGLVQETATLMLAAGLDEATLFVQSRVPAHAQLAYLLECTATTGELNRMIQFKEKGGRVGPRPSSAPAGVPSCGAPSAGAQQATQPARPPSGRGVDSPRVSLFTYPALMAADILLYRPVQVPVGADQRQHVELTRDLAVRFNRDYAPVFTVPEITVPPAGARVMRLDDPTRKMGKSDADAAGVVLLLDSPDVVRRKVARAVTDSDTGPDAVRAAPSKPGVTNLLDVLAACGGSAEGITTYGALKRVVTDAVVAVLEPLQRRYAELAEDPAHVMSVFEAGAARCREVTAPVLADAQAAMGL